MEALNLNLTKLIQGVVEKIPKPSSGQIYPILDFISFFSPFVFIKSLRLSATELVNIKSYLMATLILAITFLIIGGFSRISRPHPFLFLLAPVVINSLYGGVGPALYSIIVCLFFSSLITTNFHISGSIFQLNYTNLTYILESLFLTWIAVTQKRRQQDTVINLIHEQSARIRAQSDSLNLKRLERQKDDFIAIAAHELRNPLASAKAFSQILGQRAKSPTTKDYHSKLEQQIDRLIEMVDLLFDVSSMTSGKMALKKRIVNFDELVMTTIIDLRHTITTHELIIEGHTKTNLNVDPERMRQAIVNLVINAVKYSPNAKRVVIRLENHNHQVTFSVQDFGVGISRADQKKIFERFYRLQSQEVSGLGLGLYVTSEIVKLHYGRIWLASTLGQGSTFYVSLPKN